MARDIKGIDKVIEMSKRDDRTIKSYTYEEALDMTGHGKYNKGLLFACFMLIIAMGIDIYGVGIIVTVATCDLGLNLQQIGILSSMPFAGIIVMSYPWGYLSDTRGRKLVLMWAMSGSFISAALSSLAPSWQVLAALRFLSSAFSSAAESATYALLGECCNSTLRTRYMLLMTSALMLTPTLYYVWAYLIAKLNFTIYIMGIVYRPWRLLTLIMALPLGIGAILLWYFSESPKFLANVGRIDEAVVVLKRMYDVNGGNTEKYPVEKIHLEEGSKENVGKVTLRSLWEQIAPLFKPPLLRRTLLLYYLTFVVYIANNSFAIILPTIFNVFFTSYANRGSGSSFCELFSDGSKNETTSAVTPNTTTIPSDSECSDTISDYTIYAGCVHGLSFFVLNMLISQCARRPKVLTITILIIAAIAAIFIDLTGEAISGLFFFYIFLTTAMVFGLVSSYFVTLYPTSYRGMVACLGMMVARLSAFGGTNAVSALVGTACGTAMQAASGLVISGAIAAYFLPPDSEQIM